MAVESKLIPVLREGIEIVKMISYKKLKEALAAKYPDRESSFIARLTGALINMIFGVVPQEEPFVQFAQTHAELIAQEKAHLGAILEDLRIPLTDALRIQSLCDHQQGEDTTATLKQAQELGILLVDRDLPLPHSFTELVRRLGSAFGLLLPPLPKTEH